MNIVKTIASGAFGRVELVEDATGQQFARKVFAPSPDVIAQAGLDKLQKRFEREVRVQQSLPNHLFVPILTHDLAVDPAWFVMPLCGRTLAEEIVDHRKVGSVPTGALENILESLEYLESIGVVHRDLKPSNVLFHDGRWKLSDLGLVMAPSEAGLTSSLSAWGTMAYCAPEQCTTFKSVTSAADQFAFGCILHDIYDGAARIPYHVQTCAGDIGGVVEVCTRTDPSHRFKSIAGLRGALLGVLAKPNAAVSPIVAEIVASLANPATMSKDQLDALKAFLRSVQSSSDVWTVNAAMTEEVLEALKALDEQLWIEVAAAYCKWARTPHFDFGYCDVVIGRLQRIFELGDITQKAEVVLAGAVLGESHNRWTVMKKVVRMCDASIDNQIAKRIALEIRVEDAQQIFRRCVLAINLSIAAYHPVIAGVL